MNHLDIMDALGYAQKKYWQYISADVGWLVFFGTTLCSMGLRETKRSCYPVKFFVQ